MKSRDACSENRKHAASARTYRRVSPPAKHISSRGIPLDWVLYADYKPARQGVLGPRNRYHLPTNGPISSVPNQTTPERSLYTSRADANINVNFGTKLDTRRNSAHTTFAKL